MSPQRTAPRPTPSPVPTPPPAPAKPSTWKLIPGWLGGVIALLVVALVVALLSSRSSGSAKASFVPATVAVAKQASLPVYASPGGAMTRQLPNPDPTNYNQPLVLLVQQVQGDWLKVSLPIAPNGQSGWVRRQTVTTSTNDYRVDVSRSAHQLRVYDRDKLVRTYPIAVGTSDTPTPGGVYFIRVLLQPPNPNGDYGPYAYGLSGYSNVLTSFNGGSGVIGMHGTNEPQLIGHDVSHGCIRLSNADVTDLVNSFHLKLGTPVRILA
jgi:lipoprotein-anchoring transpeptidase ErfK/SrfK